MLSHHTKPIAYRRNFRWHIVPGEMLCDNYEITVDDLEGALKKQNLTLQPGDGAVAAALPLFRIKALAAGTRMSAWRWLTSDQDSAVGR